MLRISGVVLPGKKRIEVSLTAIKGIGRSLSKRILNELHIDLNTHTDDISETDQATLRGPNRLRMTACIGSQFFCRTFIAHSRWFAQGETNASQDFGSTVFAAAYHEGAITAVNCSIPAFLFRMYTEQHAHVFTSAHRFF